MVCGLMSYRSRRESIRKRLPASGRPSPRALRRSLNPLLSGQQFDVANAILDSLKNVKVTLDIDSRVKIDDCEFSLSMWKHDVIWYRCHRTGLQTVQRDCYCQLTTYLMLCLTDVLYRRTKLRST